jgi:RNA polymerase sigma-70 factor (ECF subfamily)
MLRHDRPRREREQTWGAARYDNVPDVSPGPDRIDDESSVAAALARLPEHLRVVVVLRYWVDLSEREIATAIKRRHGTVKSRLHEARTRLAADPALRADHPLNEAQVHRC